MLDLDLEGKYTLGLRRSAPLGRMVGLLQAPNRTCRAIANDLATVTATTVA